MFGIQHRMRFCDHFCLDGCHLKIVLIIFKHILLVDTSKYDMIDASTTLCPFLSRHVLMIF